MTDNPLPDVVVWWVADCGFTHVETNPVTIPIHCDHEVPDQKVKEYGA